MKKRLAILLAVIFSTYDLFAAEHYLTGGVNVSQFYDAIAKPLPGYSLGFGWEWNKGRSSAWLFSPSFLFRGAKLENKTIWVDSRDRLFTENIWCRRGYLDLPLLYRRYFSSHCIYLSAGVSASTAIYEASSKQVLIEKHLPTGHYPGPHDYYAGVVDKIGYDSSIDAILGAGTRLRNLSIAGYVHLAYGKIKTIYSISGINGSFITCSVIVSWYFWRR